MNGRMDDIVTHLMESIAKYSIKFFYPFERIIARKETLPSSVSQKLKFLDETEKFQMILWMKYSYMDDSIQFFPVYMATMS